MEHSGVERDTEQKISNLFLFLMMNWFCENTELLKSGFSQLLHDWIMVVIFLIFPFSSHVCSSE